MRLAGIDLAWKSDKNSTAVAIGELEGNRLHVERIEPNLRGLNELEALFEGEARLVGVAIDGPLSSRMNSANESVKDSSPAITFDAKSGVIRRIYTDTPMQEA